MNQVGVLVMEDMEKVGLLNAFFASVLLLMSALRRPRPRGKRRRQEKGRLPLLIED